MTKKNSLYTLIDKKDSYQIPIITFPSEKIEIKAKQGVLFQDIIKLSVEEGQVWLFVESVKGLVQLKDSFVSDDVIQYQVDTSLLHQGFNYEDQLICYYPGGMNIINILIMVEEDQENQEGKSEAQEEYNSRNLNAKGFFPKKNAIDVTSAVVDIEMTQKAYVVSEPIEMTLKNKSNRPVRVVLECDDEPVSPKMTEVFLSETWSQEWFIRQNTVDKLLGKFSFKSEPFMSFYVDVFIDNSFKPEKTIEITLTGYEKYDTSIKISSESLYSKKKAWIFHQYISRIIYNQSKRHITELYDAVKACLNFNPQDVDLRLLYIWLLMEYGHKKEAQIEFGKFSKYSEYYESHQRKDLIELMGHIVFRDTIEDDFDGKIDAQAHWLEVLIKARKVARGSNRYNVYRDLYGQGLRHSLMFAEVANLLNQHPILPDPEDQLYFVALKWAYNKRAISKEWLSKIDKHYYQLEKSDLMTSSLAKGIYSLRKTNNLLRLFVSMSIREGRYDLDSFDMYQEAMKQKLFVPDVEKHYLMGAFKNKETINLNLIRNFTKISLLDDEVKAYFFEEVIKHKEDHGMIYRRVLPEIIGLLEKTKLLSNELANCIYLLIEEIIKSHQNLFQSLISHQRIKSLYNYESGRYFIRDILILSLSNNPKLKEFDHTGFMKTCIAGIGYEGLINCLGEQAKLLNYYVLEHRDILQIDHTVYRFLPIEVYKANMFKESNIEKLLKGIIIDDFLDNIIKLYKGLTPDEQKSMANRIYNYIAKRVIVDDTYIDEELFLEMYSYCIDFEEDNKGLILALLKTSLIYKHKLEEELNLLKKKALKHVIIVPWLGEELDILTIEYLTKEDDQVYIYYRYEEHEAFMVSKMNHIAYGFFSYAGKLFYSEFFEYYLVVEHKDGRREIPVSDKFMKVDLYEKDEQQVDYRLDSIALSFEIDDEVGAKELMKEQCRFNQVIGQIQRY